MAHPRIPNDDDDDDDKDEDARVPRKGGVKRPSPSPMDVARAKYEKAQEEQMAAQAELECRNEVMHAAAASVIKAKWKTTLGKDYHMTATKVLIIVRDRQWPGSTRLGYQSEIDDLLNDRRPPGSKTYLFRYALKQAVAPIEEMMVVECELVKLDPDEAKLTSVLHLEYHGARTPLLNLSSVKTFLTYVLHNNNNTDLVETLSANCLKRLLFDLLAHLAYIMADLARYQNVHYLPPNSFPNPFHIYEYVLIHMPQLDPPDY